MTEIELLTKIGIILFGERWQRAMAEALGVDERNVRRWINADQKMLPERWATLLKLLKAKLREIERIVASAERVVEKVAA